jgi:hypothetical protein
MTPNKVSVRWVDTARSTFTKEARRLQNRALRGDTAVVRLGQLVFFCANQDAWMLDPEDGLARCLAHEGRKLPTGISETATQFGVEWTADYSIEGTVFIVRERETGAVRSIIGYPTQEIQSPMVS